MKARSRTLTYLVAPLTILISACGVERGSSLTAPSDLASAFLGNWSSSSIKLVADACTDFTWRATEQQGDTITGEFGATCDGGIQLSGNANGTLDRDILRWTATGDATVPGLASCPFSLSGMATLQGDAIRVDYGGTTCLGPVSGTEILRQN